MQAALFEQMLVPNVAGRAVGVGGNHPLVNLILMEDVYLPLFLDD